MLKTRLLLVLPTAAMLAIAGLCGPMSLSLSPLMLEMKISPGKSRSSEVCLANDGFAALRVSAAVEDWILDRSGDLDAAGKPPHAFSCRDWIALEKVEFELSPRDKAYFKVRASVPKGTTPGHYWAAVTFRAGPGPASASDAHGVAIREKMISAVFIKVGRFKRTGRILEADAAAVEGGTEIRLAVENTGRGYFHTAGAVELHGESGTVLTTEIPEELLLPKTRRDIAWVSESSLPPGRYTLRCRFKPPDGKAEVFEKVISVGGPL